MLANSSLRLSSIGSRWLACALLIAASALYAADKSVLEQAQTALSAGHPQKAEQIVRSALRDGNEAGLHRLLADCLEAEHDFKAAAEQYQMAATADPSETNLFAFGSELLKYHGYSQAQEIFSWAEQRFSNSPRIVVGLGISQYSLGQYDAAVATLCRAVDLDPNDTRALSFLGKMYGVSTSLDSEVQARLKDFVQRYPYNASALYYYALTLDREPVECRRLLERALSLQPYFPDAHFRLGVLYQRSGQTTKAVAQFQQAVMQQPSLNAAHYRLGQLYLQQGKKQLADTQFAILQSAREENQPPKSAADNK